VRVAPVAALEIGAVADSAGVVRAPTVARALAGTDARPVLTLLFVAGGADEGSGESGGGGIPGARVNFGAAPSPPTLARPTTVRPEAAFSGDSAPSESAWDVEVAPGVACVSVMN